MAAGDLTGDGYNDSIAVAITSNGPYIPTFVGAIPVNGLLYIAEPDTSLNRISASPDSSVELFGTTIGVADYSPATALQCGDLNGDGVDEIVLGAGNDVMVFEAQQKGIYLTPNLQSSMTIAGPLLASGRLHSARSREDISDERNLLRSSESRSRRHCDDYRKDS